MSKPKVVVGERLRLLTYMSPENGLAMLRRTSSSSDNGRTPRPTDPVTGRLLEERRVAAWIGKSILLKGDLTSSEDLTIAGQVDGDISVPEHSLIITPQAKIRGNIVARFVVVHGSVTGTITAAEKVDVGATGFVDGDVITVRMAIAEGATLRGQLGVDTLAPRT
jgi:cytoskeletal protein CcmA (bactofilin family)